jgi:hypothetical protein
MYNIAFIFGLFFTIVALVIALAMFRSRQKKQPTVPAAPPVPKPLTGPDIEAARAAITDVTSKMENMLQSLIRQRDHVWNEGQREVDRLTTEINNTLIVIEAYRNTTSSLERAAPSDPLPVPEPIAYPSATVTVDADELKDHL